MNKKDIDFVLVAIMSMFFIGACQGLEPTSSSFPAPTLSVEVDKLDENLRVVERSPIEGERLSLSSSIKLVFSQDMDTEITSDAWQFTASGDSPLEGEIYWSDKRTFTFTPAGELEPASLYTGRFDTTAVAEDGTVLFEELSFEFYTEEPISVSQTFPSDGASDVETSTSITVIFNRPIVPLSIEEERPDYPHPLTFTPALSGDGEWINSSVYIYYPDEPLAGGRTYTAKVDANLEDALGNKLGNSYRWGFSTRAPSLIQLEFKNDYWATVDYSVEKVENILLNPIFRLSFSQPMDDASVADAISIANRETGQRIAFKTSWNEDFTIVSLETTAQLKIGSFYSLDVAPIAIARNGGQLQEGRTLKFDTFPLPYIVSTTSDDPTQTDYFRPYAVVTFATPMDFETIKDRVRVSPELEGGVHLSYSEYSRQLSIYGLAPATEHIVRLLPGMADIYGNRISSGYSFSADVIDRPASARLLLPWTPLIYRAEGTQDVYFEYTNLDEGSVFLYSLSFAEFAKLLANENYAQLKFDPQDTPVNSWLVDNTIERNTVQYRKINLETEGGQALAPGYYFLGVQSSSLEYDYSFYQTHVFAVSTDNITLKATDTEAFAWVTDLETGAPQADVSVTFYDERFREIGATLTDQDGIAYLDELHKGSMYARLEDDILAGFTSLGWGNGVSVANFGIWQGYYGSSASNFGYLYTDRPLYRPGQTVQFEGIVRNNDDLRYSLVDWEQVYVRIEHQGEIVYGQYLPLTGGGNFSGEFEIADGASLGTYVMYLSRHPKQDIFESLFFRVAEYHKPEFQVSVEADNEAVSVGDEVIFSLNAAYYAGGNLANATVDWYLESRPYYFTPSKDYRQYSFVDWDRDTYRYDESNTVVNSVFAEGQDSADEKGHFEISEIIPANEEKTSQSIFWGVNITDVAGNVVSGSTTVIAHQNQVYAGIKSEQYVGAAGEEQEFEVVTLDWDSNPASDQSVFVQFFERQWFSVQEEDDQGVLRWQTSVKEIPVGQETAITDEDGLATTSFTPKTGGVYKVLVTVRDENGNEHQTSTYIWVAGKDYIPWKQNNDRSFDLISDKDLYAPGEDAEILIAQPFEGENYALVTYERGHIYHSEVVLLQDNSTVYKMPITAEMAPITYVSVTVINGAESGGKPNFKVGMIPIHVDTNEQTLQVSVTADKENAGPGEEVTYTIETKDSTGNPVSADVSLAVVDKAVLALAPSNVLPILQAFYPEQALHVQTASGIVVSADDYNAEFRETIPDGLSSGGGGGGVSQGIVTVRQNFEDTVVFKTDIKTDENGTAEVTVRLPENLTTWQATVRAVTEDSRVGEASSELLSTKSLYVNLTTPRFFVVGDQAVIGANIHNNSDKPLSVQVSLDAAGVVLKSPQEQNIEVPAQQQAYLFWEVEVLNTADRVDMTVHATSGTERDSSKPALGTLSNQGIPVYRYTVQETVGTSGMLDSANSVTEGIRLPQTLEYEDAELSVDIAPSLAASMTEGLSYLRDYPYLCMEQTVSRFLPNVIVSRALEERGLSMTTEKRILDAQVSAALQRIYSKQHADGGWAWWDSGMSDPYLSAYVVYGLIEAQKSGYDISASTLEDGLSYLSAHMPDLSKNPSTWQANRYAFMVYTLASGDRGSSTYAATLYKRRDLLSLYGKAYLLQAIHLEDPEDSRVAELLAELQTTTIMSSTGAHWEEEYRDYWNWNTDIRTTAIVLNAMVQVDGENIVTASAVRWLMAHRESGRWHSTQETTWSLIALTNWMVNSGELDASYAYAVGLNGDVLTEGNASHDNLTDNIHLQVELDQLLKDELNALVFVRGEGDGNLYYTTYLSADITVEDVQPLDQGVSVSRQYFSLDDPKKPITEIEQGELVRVRITLVTPAALHYLVVDDPLPAGFEAVDASILTDTVVPSFYTKEIYAERGWGWWYFDHVEQRDEKIVLAADYLPAGTYVYTYLARASTTGTFKVIPPTASEFYFPDVGGRGAGSLFTVTP